MRIVTPGGEVKEEVKEIMGGKILDYEAKEIRNKALEEVQAILAGEIGRNLTETPCNLPYGMI